MKSIKIFGPAPDLAIQLRYQLVSSKQRVIQTFYLHIRDCKPISNKNTSKLFQRGN